MEIDWKRFDELLPRSMRQGVAGKVYDLIRDHQAEMNAGFFARMGTYQNTRDIPDAYRMDDLFPPNMAAIDWLLSTVRGRVLDYACGLGVCSLYLKRLGCDVLSHDNWTQVPQTVVEKFQSQFVVRAEFVTWLEAEAWRPDILIACGIWLPEIPTSVQVILADAHYEQRPGGFECIAEYPTLLRVFRRLP